MHFKFETSDCSRTMWAGTVSRLRVTETEEKKFQNQNHSPDGHLSISRWLFASRCGLGLIEITLDAIFNCELCNRTCNSICSGAQPNGTFLPKHRYKWDANLSVSMIFMQKISSTLFFFCCILHYSINISMRLFLLLYRFVATTCSCIRVYRRIVLLVFGRPQK